MPNKNGVTVVIIMLRHAGVRFRRKLRRVILITFLLFLLVEEVRFFWFCGVFCFIFVGLFWFWFFASWRNLLMPKTFNKHSSNHIQTGTFFFDIYAVKQINGPTKTFQILIDRMPGVWTRIFGIAIRDDLDERNNHEEWTHWEVKGWLDPKNWRTVALELGYMNLIT